MINSNVKKKIITEIPWHRKIDDGLEKKFQQAWESAFNASEIIRKKFSVNEVRVTGSLLDRGKFREDSDIDLVVPDFNMSDMLDCGKYMEIFYPLKVDIIPLKSTTPQKADYFLERSVLIGKKNKP